MIHYDPHRWIDHFFDVRGTLVREIGTRVAICTVWSAAVVLVHRHVTSLAVPISVHSLVGLALGLLLVFRTNASYDRYWEGRRLWGGIVNESRNLIRAASVQLAREPELLLRLTRWSAVFPYAVMSTLRGESAFGPAAAELVPEQRAELTQAQHPALHAAQQMTRCLEQARSRGTLSDILYASIESNVQLLVDYVGGCERIRKTPLPFAYVVHLRRALVIYCFTLPFALVDSFGWFTVLDVLFVSYTFFGIEEIGVEIEGPFGDDANDLPMREISETIRDNVYSLAGIAGPAPRETLPEGL